MFRYDILNFILKATNENIAMVTLHVENITWLGKPYSICAFNIRFIKSEVRPSLTSLR